MADTIIAVFDDSKAAGDAVAQLKNQGYTNDVSVIAKDEEGHVRTHEIEQDLSEGTMVGAAGGAAVGGIAALLAGLSTVTLPGLGILIGGSIASILTAAGVGAVAGGLVGALVDYGIPENKAEYYERRVNDGQVLVAVSADSMKAARILKRRGAVEIQSFHDT